jgi:hypothetical protein
MVATSNKLTNTQLEILKTFSYEMQEDELQDLKKVLVNFFADRIRTRAGRLWQEKGYNDQTMQDWLNDERQ